MQLPVFIVTVVAAVVLLGLTIWSGRTARRKPHFWLVGVTVLLLLAAVAQADRLGHGYHFTTWRLLTHLVVAFLALASFPGLAFSGFRLRQDPRWRKAHKRWLGVFLLLVFSAVVTSIWMFLDAVPLAE